MNPPTDAEVQAFRRGATAMRNKIFLRLMRAPEVSEDLRAEIQLMSYPIDSGHETIIPVDVTGTRLDEP